MPEIQMRHNYQSNGNCAGPSNKGMRLSAMSFTLIVLLESWSPRTFVWPCAAHVR
jgi:hypothetical protein